MNASSSVFLALSMILAACGPGTLGKPATVDPSASASEARVHSVREILNGTQGIGVAVDVRGRCVRLDEKLAFGSPPRTRSDWQLRDEEETNTAIWISGSRPRDCGYDQGSTAAVTVRAQIVEDSVVQEGGVKVARRYLSLIE